jgi:hypothetical protein
MGKFGDLAIKIVESINIYDYNPKIAWEKEIANYCFTLSMQKKNCPKSAFLGLCEERFVKGIPKGNYTNSKTNKQYSITAYQYLLSTNSCPSESVLWGIATKGANIHSNQQMEIVISLWQVKLLLMT